MNASGIKRMLVKGIQNRARIILVGKPGLGLRLLLNGPRIKMTNLAVAYS
jgi:hypothetical protein